MMNSELRKGCPMRHENGNCMPAGGFCTANNDCICKALHNAYEDGYVAGQGGRWVSVKDRLPEQGQRYLVIWHSSLSKHAHFMDILWHDAHDLWWNRLYKKMILSSPIGCRCQNRRR